MAPRRYNEPTRWTIAGVDADTPVVILEDDSDVGRWHLVLFSDEQRRRLAMVEKQAERAEGVLVVKQERQSWWRTRWGVVVAMLTAAALLTDIIGNIVHTVHP